MPHTTTLHGYSVKRTNPTDQGANPYKRLNNPPKPQPKCTCPYPECKTTWHIPHNND